MDLISVIVPIYKVEAYLDRCVQSIVNQTYTNLEIILVDDGSPDRCPQMCDAWAKRDSRIRVIHKENGGLSDARNAGMRVMRGEYVAFVDSDDWLEKQFIEKMYMTAVEQDCEVVGCAFRELDCEAKGSDIQASRLIRVVDRVTAVRDLIDDKIRQVVWNKLYRRNLIADIPFAKGKCHEDDFWSYQVLGCVTKYAEIDYVGYNYFQRPQSIMGEAYSLKRLDGLEARVARQLYLQEKLPELADKGQINLFFTCIYQGQLTLKYLSRADQQTAFSQIEKISRQWLLSDRQKRMLKPTHRVWVQMAQCSLVLACYVRNLLGVGL